MKKIDACGISCPEPLLMLKNALNNEKEIVMFVDSKNALKNCEEYAIKKGFSVNTITCQDKYEIHIAERK